MASRQNLGSRDVQTVTPEGAPTTPTIEGVTTHTPVTHVDHRGALHEIYSPLMNDDPVVYAY